MDQFIRYSESTACNQNPVIAVRIRDLQPTSIPFCNTLDPPHHSLIAWCFQKVDPTIMF
jgi:hypothetical protein